MRAHGFTLVEVLVAMGVLSAAVGSGAYLVVFGARAMDVARMQGTSAVAASARLDELRTLRFEFDASGQRVTDVSTNLAVDPPVTGGSGLTPGGAGTLEADVSGFVDFLDAAGNWVGNGPAPPQRAAFVRRWAIDSKESQDLLVLQVLVRPIMSGTAGSTRRPGDARLVTTRVRVQR